ncbi:MAG: alpha/beta hydrolase [Bacteroidetes bacterium]|nr:alpha/beta hydrolase [Bacteroidota bacterium]
MILETADKRTLYYEVIGNTTSETSIVFLNGLTQNTASWGLVTPFFLKNYKLILLDFVFQGQSSKDGEWKDFDSHANDVANLLHKLNIKKTIVCGLSYGSIVAQHFAILYPAKTEKLILLSTFAHKTPYYEALEHSWWRALELGGYNLMLDVMLPSVLSENYFSNPLIPIEAMKESRKDLNQNKQALFNLMRATKERSDYRQKIEQVKCPTLIIHGEKDLLLSVHLANEVHLHISNSKFIVLKNAGHTLNLEHVQEVCGLITQFIETNAATR